MPWVGVAWVCSRVVSDATGRLEVIMRSEENRNDEQQHISGFEQLPFPPLEPEPEYTPPEDADLPPADAGDLFRDSQISSAEEQAHVALLRPHRLIPHPTLLVGQ